MYCLDVQRPNDILLTQNNKLFIKLVRDNIHNLKPKEYN